MILVTGGAFAGKTSYVLEHFDITEESMLNGTTCELAETMTAACIWNYQLLVRRLLLSGTSPLEFTEQLIQVNPDCIIIMDEIGSGIIPLAEEERLWREASGQCGCLIARHAEKVIRICCGCAAVIKEESL